MRKNITNELPDKPSELLELALSDLEKVERSPRYEVSMNTWHRPTKGGVCEVCMAGAVMAKTIKTDRFEQFTDEDFETDAKKKLIALNDFREGSLDIGLKTLGIDHPRFLASEIDVTGYHDDPKEFKKDMRAVIKALKGEGL